MLATNGFDTTIFACSFNHSSFREERLKYKELFKVEDIQGVRFFWIKAPSYYKNDWRRILNMVIYSARVFIMSKNLDQIPTIILASNPHLFSGLIGYLLAKKYNAPFVFEVRDLWPQVFVDIGAFHPKHPLILLMKFIERFIYSHADNIITLMPNASEYIEASGGDRNKINYLPHGVDVELFQGSGDNLPQELPEELKKIKTSGKLIVGYIGAHGIADALDTLIDCCYLLQSEGREKPHFVLVGNGSEKERLEKRACHLNLRNISFYTSVQKNIVPGVIKLFDVAVVCKKDSPLYKYGTSFIKTFDYMACGVPILWAVNAPDCPVIDAGCGIAVPSEQPEKMAEAIKFFTEMDEETRKDIGRNGLDYVRKNHDSKVLVQKLISLFEILASRPVSRNVFKTRCISLKILLDWIGSFFGMIMMLPVFLWVACRIKIEDNGPIFYRGERTGLNGKPFRIFKFRTMVVDAEKLGASSTSDDDARITKIGRFLRRYKLDELPQLINVLNGDMSLVGPRPEVKKFTDLYTEEEKLILSVRPGITDWASIWNPDEGAILAGSPDPDRDYLEKIRPEKIRLQLKYVRERSFWTDIRILFLTLKTILIK